MRKKQSFNEALEDLRKAFRELLDAISKAFKMDEAVDWLDRMLRRFFK